ncbi:MAG: hypothetical protein ACKOAD_07875 [Gammaproteobacteria bacterium]
MNLFVQSSTLIALNPNQSSSPRPKTLNDTKQEAEQPQRILKARLKALKAGFEKLELEITRTPPPKSPNTSPYIQFIKKVQFLQTLFTKALNNSAELTQIQTAKEAFLGISYIFELVKKLEIRMEQWNKKFKKELMALKKTDLEILGHMEYQKILIECYHSAKLQIQALSPYFSIEIPEQNTYDLILKQIQDLIVSKALRILLQSAHMAIYGILGIPKQTGLLDHAEHFYKNFKPHALRIKEIMQIMLTHWLGRCYLEPIIDTANDHAKFFQRLEAGQTDSFSFPELNVLNHTAFSFLLFKILECEIKDEKEIINSFESKVLNKIPFAIRKNLLDENLSKLGLLEEEDLRNFPQSCLNKLLPLSDVFLRLYDEISKKMFGSNLLDSRNTFLAFSGYRKITIIHHSEDLSLWDSLIWYQRNLTENIQRGDLRERKEILQHIEALHNFRLGLSQTPLKHDAEHLVESAIQKLNDLLQKIETANAAFDAIHAELRFAETAKTEFEERKIRRAKKKLKKKIKSKKLSLLEACDKASLSAPAGTEEKSEQPEPKTFPGKNESASTSPLAIDASNRPNLDNGINKITDISTRDLNHKLPPAVLSWFDQFKALGFSLKLHGGFILDYLLNREPLDLDFISNADSTFIQNLAIDQRFFKQNPYKLSLFSTLTNEGLSLEIWQSDLDESRTADFTVSSFSYDGKSISAGSAQAQEDFFNRRIRLMPHKTLETDPILILKVIRLCQKGFTVPETLAKELKEALKALQIELRKNHIPYLVYLKKLLLNGQARRTLEFLNKYGILDVLLPSIAPEQFERFLEIMNSLDKQFRKIRYMRQLGIASLPRIFSDFLAFSNLPSSESPDALFKTLAAQFPILQDWCKIMQNTPMARESFLKKINPSLELDSSSPSETQKPIFK